MNKAIQEFNRLSSSTTKSVILRELKKNNVTPASAFGEFFIAYNSLSLPMRKRVTKTLSKKYTDLGIKIRQPPK